MAVVDVTDHGIVTNDTSLSTAESNADAFEDLFNNTLNAADTVYVPGFVYVGRSSSRLGLNQFRTVIYDPDDGAPTNITFEGPTSNGEPAAGIRTSPEVDTNSWLWLFYGRSGLDLTVKNLVFDNNFPNVAASEMRYSLVFDNTDPGAVNSISLENVQIMQGGATCAQVFEANGITFDRVTLGPNDGVNHGLSVSQTDYADADAKAAPIVVTNSHAYRNKNGNGVNASPGEVRVDNTVFEENESAWKDGNEGQNSALDAHFVKCRAFGMTARGVDTVTESTPQDADGNPVSPRLHMEDVIIDGPTGSGTGEPLDVDGPIEVFVPSGSKLILTNGSEEAAYMRQDSFFTVEGTLEACGFPADGIFYDSTADSTIDTYRYNNIGDQPINEFGSGSVTVSTTEAGVACDSDIAGVPTASEVGVGTASSTSGGDRGGVLTSRGGVLGSRGGSLTQPSTPTGAVTTIDSFEDQDLTEYTQDTFAFSIVDPTTLTPSWNAPDGTYVVASNTGNDSNQIFSTSGLNAYFGKGESARVYVRSDDAAGRVWVMYGLSDASNHYFAELNWGTGEFRLLRDDGGATNLASATPSLSADTTYQIQIDWHDGNGSKADNTHVLTLLDESGSQVSQIEATDSVHAANTGVGLQVFADNDHRKFMDYFRKAALEYWTPGGGGPTVIESFEGDLSAYTEPQGGTQTTTDESGLSFSAIDGSNVLEMGDAELRYDGTSLTDEFVKGTEAKLYLRSTDVTAGEWRFEFGREDSDNYYYIRLDFDNDGFDLLELDGGATTQLSPNDPVSYSADTWYEVTIKWDDGTLGGSDGDITISLRDYDADSELVAPTTANSTANNGNVHGWDPGGTVGTNYADYLHAVSG